MEEHDDCRLLRKPPHVEIEDGLVFFRSRKQLTSMPVHVAKLLNREVARQIAEWEAGQSVVPFEKRG